MPVQRKKDTPRVRNANNTAADASRPRRQQPSIRNYASFERIDEPIANPVRKAPNPSASLLADDPEASINLDDIPEGDDVDETPEDNDIDDGEDTDGEDTTNAMVTERPEFAIQQLLHTLRVARDLNHKVAKPRAETTWVKYHYNIQHWIAVMRGIG